MLKITIDGETYLYDETSQPLSEGIELEEGLGMSYGAYQAGITAESAKAMAGFVWSVLKRNGRDVKLADILTGEYPVNMAAITMAEEGGENPTGDAPPSSPATSGPTSASSPTSSATPRRRSAS